jgi:hypothetical protein
MPLGGEGGRSMGQLYTRVFLSGTILVLALVSAPPVAQAAPPDFAACEEAGLTGQAMGLCRAFHAVDCLADGSPTACARIEEQYAALGIGAMPGAAGACPCWESAEHVNATSPLSDVPTNYYGVYCDEAMFRMLPCLTCQPLSLDLVWNEAAWSCQWEDGIGETTVMARPIATMEDHLACTDALQQSDIWLEYCAL